MKFIHIADIHASRERLPQTLSILDTLTERCKQGDINFIIFAGDFWDSTITATKGSGFSDICAAIKKLEKYTVLHFIYGTPTHEPNGSLDAFKSDKSFVHNKMEYITTSLCDIICIPEPRRSEYVTDSVQKTNDLINSTTESFIKESVKTHESFIEYLPILETYVYKKPLVVVYHGEVKGAVYQNGTSASCPTAISKDLLQSLKADYYAFGHIHLPQEVFNNAWYSGSACPKNFGEIHDGHYNLVTVANGETKVEQVSFNLPTYKTISLDSPNFPFIKGETNFYNQYLRVQFMCTKEERKDLNLKEIADEIKERTNALSVKLEPCVVEGETIEKSEIVKCKSIVEKLSEYVKEKCLKAPKYTMELLQDIQDSTLPTLAYPHHSFELLHLSLRGAIGIRDGQHKEEFEIDFEKLEDGVVCLAGSSGHGKSTLLENCHPYPKMLTRDGTLKDHFYLKDSHRILIYKDENGLFYRISILIDGKSANGKASYYAATSKNREVWNSVSDVDGSLESYKKWVDETFGSIDVFLRTAFFAKEQTKDAKDISATTKSERMELLSKLAGTEHLKQVSKVAADLRKELEKEAEKIEMRIDSYAHYEDSIKQNEQDIISWEHELKSQKKAVTDLEKEVADLKLKDAEYQKNKALAESNKALYEQYLKQKETLESECVELDRAIGCYKEVSQIKEKKTALAESNKKIPELQKQCVSKKKEIEEVEEEISAVRKDREQQTKQFNKLDTEIKLVKQQIIPVSETCPTCGAKLSKDKYAELSSVVKENESKLHELITEQNKYIVPEEKEDWTLMSLINKNDALKDELGTLDCALMTLIDNVSDCNNFLEQWSNFEKFANKSKDELETELETHKAQIQELESKLDDIVYDSEFEDVSAKLNETEQKLKRETNRMTELSAQIKSAEKENERYRKELKTVADKKEELNLIEEKVTAYEFIEDAFSNKGIPAIELRESAPEIADITNKILRDSYGNKFTIRFGSTSELKANRKADEDFNILVYDNENNDEKTIDLVSSGEKIWIKQALFYAFSIVQMNRTGFNFRTRLIDESDGSLDGASRPKYMDMVTSVHKIANARVTILISHSQEIKDIAQQIIEI